MSVYREKSSGNWYINLSHEGKRRRMKSPENSKRGAQAFETLLRRRLVEGEDISSFGQKSKVTEAKKEEQKAIPDFRSFTKEWLATAVQTNNKPSEYRRKKSILSNHLLPFFGAMKLDEIDVRTIEQYKAKKLSSTRKGLLSPKTINNHLSVLRRAITCAHEWKIAPYIPCVKQLKVPPSEMRYLNNSEIEQLLESEQNPCWNLMILMALDTGMRIGEILALHWKDIDFELGTIYVRCSLSGTIITSTKTNKARMMPMSARLYRRLLEWRESIDSDLVFPSRQTGQSWSRSTVSAALQKRCNLLGLENVSWHTFRHTFGTRLSTGGAPFRAIQKLLGHKTIEMTERYSHVPDEVLRSAIDMLNDDNGYITFGQYMDRMSTQKEALPLLCLPPKT